MTFPAQEPSANLPKVETIPGRVERSLSSHEFTDRLALADASFVAQLVSSELALIDPTIQLTAMGERTRGPHREILVTWREGDSGAMHEEVILVPPVTK